MEPEEAAAAISETLSSTEGLQDAVRDMRSDSVLLSLRAAAADASLSDAERSEKVSRLLAIFKLVLLRQHLRDDAEPNRVAEGLYIGSIGAAFSRDILLREGVTHVLTVANALLPRFPDAFEYRVVPVLDSPDCDIAALFDECIAFIDAALASGGRVLVHCFAGRSRSASVVLAYLMRVHGMALADALEHLRAVRPVVCPNSGFMRQLEAFEAGVRAQRLQSEER